MSTSFDAVEAYRRLYLIRHVEEEIARRYYPDPQDKSKSPMRCPVHLSIGQEGVAVGVAMAVPKGTHAYSTHRCHAHYLAWGGNVDAMVAELYGKSSGCSGGRAGSMHLHDETVGFMGTSAIVGSSISLAVGDSFSSHLAGSDRISVAFGGDAVLETGQFWEALNFAMLHQLRMIFVVEDNGLSTATPKSKRQHLGMGALMAPARWMEYDFDDAEHVANAVTTALGYLLPTVLVFRTRRFYVHVGTERMPEYQTYPDDDPVKIGRVPNANEIELETEVKVAKAFRRAERAAWPM